MDDLRVSESALALEAWVKDGGEASPAARDGAREVIDEARQLRAILRSLAHGGLGEGAMFEMLRPTESAILRVVICCGSQNEGALTDAVYSALREVFARYGADVDMGTPTACGATAMDSEAAQ